MKKIILLLLSTVLVFSCKTKYVTVPEYHQVFVEKHDTLLHRDSIFEKDSVFVIQNGDTVTITRTKILYKDRWRERIIYRDSIRVDSIRVPYPVEKEIPFWQRGWLKIGKVLGIVCILIIMVSFLRKWLLARSRC